MKPFIRKPRNRERRPSKNEILRLYKKGMTQKEIGRRFGWTQSGMSELMKRYDLRTESDIPWAKEEEELLKRNYLRLSKKDILQLFRKRSWGAIKLKALKLNLARSKEEYSHSNEVKQRLKKLAKKRLIKPRFNKKKDLAYILGVLDGDGYTNRRETIGLETKTKEFAEKFKRKLRNIGLNSNMGFSEKKNHWLVWGSSKKLVLWYLSLSDKKKKRWLLKEKIAWEYFNGLYDSDGALHPCGCPQICCHNLKERVFINKLLTALGISSNIHKDKVWIRARSRSDFFSNVYSVISYRNPQKGRCKVR